MRKTIFIFLILFAASLCFLQAAVVKEKARKVSAEVDYTISLSGNASLRPTSLPPFGTTFTISGWIQPSSTSAGDRCIAAWATAANGNVGNFFRLEADNYLYYGQWNGSFKKIKSKTALANGKWQHIALVKDNNTVRIYINGVESTGSYASGAAPMDNNTAGDAFRFGGMYQNNSFQQGFKGEINNFALYTSARTTAQIADEFTNGVNLSETTLWGCWDFDNQASPVTDKSAKANTLNLENATYKVKGEDIVPDGGVLSTGFVKNSTARGYITSNTAGKLYWAIYPATVIDITIDKVKSGTDAVKFGTKNYATPTRQDFWLVNGLTPTTTYTLYGVLEVVGAESKLISINFTTTDVKSDLTGQINSVKALMKRLLPARATEFEFAAIDKKDDVLDVFELSSVDGKILVKGSSGTAMAAGVRYYLNTYCKASFSWTGDQNVLPVPLPALTATVRKETSYQHRYALNYCTLNYTMSFWDWERWEREIDLMATQGINLFLSGIGTEAIWQNVMAKYGYTFAEIQKFIPGPAYTAWWLMGNLEGEGGPVSQEYINGRVELQKKIIARAKELGMEVVLQGFAGLAPTTIKSKMPDIEVTGQGNWAGGYLRPVAVSGPKAMELAKTWYEESIKLYGKSNYYGGDLFHEGGIVPAGLDVSKYAGDIQAEMLKQNPEAVWVLQSWLSNPKVEVLNGLKKDQALIIDLGNERDEGWKRIPAFTGIPWVYSVIQNFGARMGIYGRIPAIADRHDAMLTNVNKGNNWGIGIAPEAIIFNQASYDIIWDMVWSNAKIDTKAFMARFSDYRYGQTSTKAQNAWEILRTTALNCAGGSGQDGASESVIGARPSLSVGNVSAWSTTKLYYDPKAIIPAWTLMINSADELQDKTTFRFDLVDLTRQNLSNYAQILQKEWAAAFTAKDKATFTAKSKLFLELILDQDSLLRTRQETMLGPWIAKARQMGTTSTEANLFEKNARALITTWKTTEDTNLHDYSYREWGGLIKDVYYKRWKLYIDDLAGQLDGKSAVNNNFFTKVELPFLTKYADKYQTTTQGDEIVLSKYMYEKYLPLFQGTQKRIFTVSEKQVKGAEVGVLSVTGANLFELQNQSVADAFAIDASSGRITVNKPEVMLQGLNPTFSIRLKATNSTNSSFVDYVDVTINLTATSGIAEKSYQSDVRLFPNPVRGSLIVELPVEQVVDFTVSNENGAVLLQRQDRGNKFLFDTKNFIGGVYFLNIKSSLINGSYKFLVSKP